MGLIAVEDFVGAAGATVWWSLHQTTLAELEPVWVAAGLPSALLPPPPTPERRLGRAVREAIRTAPVAGRLEGTPIKRRGAWQVDHADVVDTGGTVAKGVEFLAVARAQIEGDALVLDDLGTLSGYEVCAEIRRIYERDSTLLDANDVGLWLTSLIERTFSGIRLRRAGGCYYVPPANAESLAVVANLLREAGVGEVQLLPTLPSEAAAQAVLSALAAEVGDVTDAVAAEISEGNVGVRALRSRVASLDDLVAKLGDYESLLGSALDSVRQRVTDAQTAATLAAFEIEAKAADAALASQG